MKIQQKLLNKFYKGDNRLNLLDQRYLPRWIVILIDVILCVISLLLVYFILLGTPIKFSNYFSVLEQGGVILVVNIIFFYGFKTYSGIIRHSTFIDILKLAFASFTTATSILLFNVIYSISTGNKIFLTTSVLLYMLISFSIMLLFRIAVKETYQYIKDFGAGISRKRVAIAGVDDHTISLAKALTTESNLPFKLVGFLTENLVSKKYKILGKPVIPVKTNFSEVIERLNIEGILMMSESLSSKEKNKIVEQCLTNNIKIYNVPLLEQWDKKEDIKNQIKPIQIEDLLERDQITIESETIKSSLDGKTVLVTGGAGSIGSEIVRQIAGFNPKQVVILDQAESALHELELYLLENYPSLNFITELANISNMYRLELLFTKYKFNVVYHAAAYKHVPIIERNPHEAIYVNILGTVNLSVLSVDNKVDKFVMVSTDKAVNPTNVMGASKRAAEMYVQALQNDNKLHTRFITTRFGNVLGSSGSVIPHFRKQIAQGGPVTVTHKDIIRYFMTIPEACQLVLEAGAMGNGGEVFIFDMGKAVKIIDLAKKIIRLAGFTPYKEIDIKVIGLRPGEKLYEELLNEKSSTLPTYNEKIMIAKVETYDYETISNAILELIELAKTQNKNDIVKKMKAIVPEFVSMNSDFQKFDN